MKPVINYIAREFADILKELGGGMASQELTEKLNEVTKACINTGKGGALTLSITMSPQGTGQAIVAYAVKAKIPEFSKQPTIMFIDDDSNLTRRNPKQMSFGDIIDVSRDKPVINIDKETGEIIETK